MHDSAERNERLKLQKLHCPLLQLAQDMNISDIMKDDKRNKCRILLVFPSNIVLDSILTKLQISVQAPIHISLVMLCGALLIWVRNVALLLMQPTKTIWMLLQNNLQVCNDCDAASVNAMNLNTNKYDNFESVIYNAITKAIFNVYAA
jgi:hypothetical protein